MKCHILFSMENKKNIISLSSAESAHSLVSVQGLTIGYKKLTKAAGKSAMKESGKIMLLDYSN